MIRHIFTVSTGTLASRLLGFLRDAMVAALLGAGPIADALLVAFQLVNVVRRLLSEGALNAALVPAYWRVRDSEGVAAAAAFAGRVLGTISLALFVIAAVIALAMPLVIALLAPGFVGTPTLQLAVDDARLMLPYLAFAGPVTVMMGLLNAHHRFALTAFSPLLFNLALIATALALLVWRRDAAHSALVIAAAVGIAGLLQLLILATRGGGLATPLRVSFDAEMRGFIGKAIPGMIANSGPQLLVVAGAVIASASPAAVSWLYFANRLIELPLGIVGVAMGTVLVPELTRATRSDDAVSFTQTASRGIELAVGLALPAMLGLMILSQPIVRALFEHGAFTADDAHATALALSCLALGLPAHVLVKALAPAFFSRGDTSTPCRAVVISIVVTVVLALLLGRWFGASGVAIAIALGAWSNAISLIRRAAASFGAHIDAMARRRLPRIVAAALVMGGALWLCAAFALPAISGAHGMVRIVTLGLLIAGGGVAYGLLLRLFGVVTWTEASHAWRSAPPRD
jgi:putative peptidoglycan lipid II flippase